MSVELPATFSRGAIKIELERIGPVTASKEPACCACHYDAKNKLSIGDFEVMFCDRCLLDALLDAVVVALDTQDVAVGTLPPVG